MEATNTIDNRDRSFFLIMYFGNGYLIEDFNLDYELISGSIVSIACHFIYTGELIDTAFIDDEVLQIEFRRDYFDNWCSREYGINIYVNNILIETVYFTIE